MDSYIFLINLDKHPNKYERAYNILLEQGFNNVQRISGVDGSQMKEHLPDIASLHTQYLLANPEYRCSHQQLNTMGAIGCYLSHVKCWKELLKTTYPGVIIFEDDLNFIPNFKEEFEMAIHYMPIECDVFSFGYVTLTDVHSNFSKPVETHKTKFYGTQAYYITRQGATKLLTKAFPIEMHVDAYMSMMNYFGDICIYFTQRTLVTQENITGSSILSNIPCYKCDLPNIQSIPSCDKCSVKNTKSVIMYYDWIRRGGMLIFVIGIITLFFTFITRSR